MLIIIKYHINIINNNYSPIDWLIIVMMSLIGQPFNTGRKKSKCFTRWKVWKDFAWLNSTMTNYEPTLKSLEMETKIVFRYETQNISFAFHLETDSSRRGTLLFHRSHCRHWAPQRYSTRESHLQQINAASSPASVRTPHTNKRLLNYQCWEEICLPSALKSRNLRTELELSSKYKEFHQARFWLSLFSEDDEIDLETEGEIVDEPK